MPRGAPRGKREGGARGAGSSLGTLPSGRTWLVLETPLLGGPPPRGQCPCAGARPQPYLRREWASRLTSGCCREQNPVPCKVCVSTRVFNTPSPEKLRVRVQTCCYFLLYLCGSSCEFVLRFVYPPACAGLSGRHGAPGLPRPKRERGSLYTQGSPGKDSFSFNTSSPSRLLPRRPGPNGPNGAQTGLPPPPRGPRGASPCTPRRAVGPPP